MGARPPLTERARTAGQVLRPVRFEPPALTHVVRTGRVREDHADELRAARALVAAAQRLDVRDADDLATIERDTVRFGVDLAAELIGRELATCDDVVAAAVTRALGLAPDRGVIELHVHPTDRALAEVAVGAHPAVARRVELVADLAVERGGCVAVVGPLRIDAQVGAALGRVRAELDAHGA